MAKCPDYEEEINEGTELNTAPKKYKSYGQYSDKKSLLYGEKDRDEEIFGKKEKEAQDAGDQPITSKVLIELLLCSCAFLGRGLCLNSVGPTLIDLRQIASLTISQAAYIFGSQSSGLLIGSILAKIMLQEFNTQFALGMCLFIQGFSTMLIPAFHSAVIMCIMFLFQGFAIGVVIIGVCSTCIRIGGKKRNGMFLQAAYLGVAIGSVCGPFVARPFLSTVAQVEVDEEDEIISSYINSHSTVAPSVFLVNQSVPLSPAPLNSVPLVMASVLTSTMTPTSPGIVFTQTHVNIYYLIIGIIICIPATSFMVLYWKSGNPIKNPKDDSSKTESLSLNDCTAPLSITIAMTFLLCLFYFGIQDSYSHLVTSFAILGPLKFSTSQGVYISSLFWSSMCFGRLNGIWIAKMISPFKMLLMDISVALIAGAFLMFFADKSAGVLWAFTSVLGLFFATINGAVVAWAAKHLPSNNYILAIIMVGRCAGALVLPTTATTLFEHSGPMALMYIVFTVTCLKLAILLLSQFSVIKYGIDGKLYSRSGMINLT